MTRAEQIKAWRKETGGGYKAAARHFGITEAEVRKLCGVGPKVRTRARKAEHPADISKEAYLRQQLADMHVHVANMAEANSYQALVTGMMGALAIRSELDELLLAQEAEEFDPHDLDKLAREMLELPGAIWAHPLIQQATSKVH